MKSNTLRKKRRTSTQGIKLDLFCFQSFDECTIWFQEEKNIRAITLQGLHNMLEKTNSLHLLSTDQWKMSRR